MITETPKLPVSLEVLDLHLEKFFDDKWPEAQINKIIEKNIRVRYKISIDKCEIS